MAVFINIHDGNPEPVLGVTRLPVVQILGNVDLFGQRFCLHR